MSVLSQGILFSRSRDVAYTRDSNARLALSEVRIQRATAKFQKGKHTGRDVWRRWGDVALGRRVGEWLRETHAAGSWSVDGAARCSREC